MTPCPNAALLGQPPASSTSQAPWSPRGHWLSSGAPDSEAAWACGQCATHAGGEAWDHSGQEVDTGSWSVMTPSHHEAHCPGPHGSVRLTAWPAHSRPRPPRGAGTSSHQRRPVEHTAGDPRPPRFPLAPGGHRTWGGGHRLQGCRPSSRCVPPLTRSPRLSSATHHRMWSRLRHKLHQSRALCCSRPRPGAPRGPPHSPRPPCMARGPVLGAQPSCADPAAAQAATGATQSQERHR